MKSYQQIASIFRQVAAIAAIVVGALPQIGLPARVATPLIAAGGILLAIEHYLSDPSTGTPSPPKAPGAQ